MGLWKAVITSTERFTTPVESLEGDFEGFEGWDFCWQLYAVLMQLRAVQTLPVLQA